MRLVGSPTVPQSPQDLSPHQQVWWTGSRKPSRVAPDPGLMNRGPPSPTLATARLSCPYSPAHCSLLTPPPCPPGLSVLVNKWPGCSSEREATGPRCAVHAPQGPLPGLCTWAPRRASASSPVQWGRAAAREGRFCAPPPGGGPGRSGGRARGSPWICFFSSPLRVQLLLSTPSYSV